MDESDRSSSSGGDTDEMQRDNGVKRNGLKPTAPVKKKMLTKKKKTKKPKDMPRRPLSAYNIFFREERSRILEEREACREGGSGPNLFAALGKEVARRWKNLEEKELSKYNRMAEEEMSRYRKEMDEYHIGLARKRKVEQHEMQAKAAAENAATAPKSSNDLIQSQISPPVVPKTDTQQLSLDLQNQGNQNFDQILNLMRLQGQGAASGGQSNALSPSLIGQLGQNQLQLGQSNQQQSFLQQQLSLNNPQDILQLQQERQRQAAVTRLAQLQSSQSTQSDDGMAGYLQLLQQQQQQLQEQQQQQPQSFDFVSNLLRQQQQQTQQQGLSSEQQQQLQLLQQQQQQLQINGFSDTQSSNMLQMLQQQLQSSQNQSSQNGGGFNLFNNGFGGGF